MTSRPLHLLFLFSLLLAAPAQSERADCKKAQEIYRKGVQSRDYVYREKLFRQAVQVCPSFAEAHANLADALERLGRLEEAERHYREAVKLKPRLSVAFFGLGDVLRKQGRYAEAVAAYRHGLSLNPEDRLGRQGLVQARDKLPAGHPLQLVDAEEILQHFAHAIRSGAQSGSPLSFRNISFLKDPYVPSPTAELQLNEIGAALSNLVRWAKVRFRIVVEWSGPEKSEIAERRAAYLVETLRKKFSVLEGHLRSIVAEGEQTHSIVTVALDSISQEAPRLMGPSFSPRRPEPSPAPSAVDRPQGVTGTPGRELQPEERP